MAKSPQPRRNLHENGVLDIDAIDGTTFYRNFRFQKGDLDDLIVGLLIPGEVMSAQRVRVSDREALCMTLRRLAYPNRLCDLETIFNRHSSVISKPATVFTGRAPERCSTSGFIDGTARRIYRPSKLQQEHYSGHKRFHCQKYQAVMCANRIICQLDSPFRGRRHDAGILKDTRLYENIVKPYQAHFNKCMSTVRQAVEWGFGNVAADFAFVDFHKNLKVTCPSVGRMYKVATLLTNCRTCLYDSQVSMYFGLEQPSLSDYLFPFN
ncbi:hypothetical protein MRX96_038865 [Rhipicephalus microplus]